jgi:hypothetical protein
MTAMEDDRLDAVLAGWLPISSLDDKKLADSYPRTLRAMLNENSLDPKMRRAYDSMVSELYARADERLRAGLLESVDTMVEIMQDYSNDPALRYRAAKDLFERFRGKTPEVVELRHDKPFQVMLERIVAGPRNISSERPIEIEEAEVVPDLKILSEEWEFMRNWSADEWRQGASLEGL